MDIDLNSLSLKELKELQVTVGKAIATFQDRRKKEAIAELEERARAHGFSLAELTGGNASPKRRAAVSAKYVNPDDRSDTWSGRGRRPRWFEAALKSGKSPEDLTV